METAIKDAVNDEPAEGHSKHDTVDILRGPSLDGRIVDGRIIFLRVITVSDSHYSDV